MGVSAALLVLEVWLARVGRQQAMDAVCEAMDADDEDMTAAQSTGGSPPSKWSSGVDS
jgi:hypothetical protein